MSQVPVLSGTIPPFIEVAIPNYGAISTACYSANAFVFVPADPVHSCAFGDRQAKRTILLFGDDNAVQWLPALSSLAVQYKWRVVFVAKPKCSPWIYGSTSRRANCRRFVDQEIAFANRLHPQIMFPVGAKIAWRGTKIASVVHLKSEMRTTLAALSPSRSKIILLETIPQFNAGYTTQSPTTCLRYPRLLRTCESVIHNFLLNNTAGRAIWEIATEQKLLVVPMRQFFCTVRRCALYVATPAGTWLVYTDRAHMTGYFSQLLTTALGEYLAPELT